MKKRLIIMSALLVTLLASCSKEIDDADGQGKYETTIQAVADFALADGEAMPATRAAANVDRYVIEVYSDADCTTAANVFADGTNKASNATGSFSMTLDNRQSYYCLLLADGAASAVYDVSSLKNVSLKAGAKPVEAFHGKLTISQAKPTHSVSLNRAVANIVLKEVGTLPAGTLTMKFGQKTAFNVRTATTTGEATDRTDSFTLEESTGVLNTGAIFVLAPTQITEMIDIVFKYAEEAEFLVFAKIQANYNTNLIGGYTKDIMLSL